MSSDYMKINGKNYLRKVIQEAEEKADSKKGSKLSLTDARVIFKGLSSDTGSLNETEIRTVSYILEKYSFTEPALKWIENMLSQSESLEDIPDTGHADQELESYKESEENITGLKSREEKSFSLKKIIISLIVFAALIAAAGIFFGKKEKFQPHTDIEDDKVTMNNEPAEEKEPAVKREDDQIPPAAEDEKAGVEPESKLYIVKNKDTLIKISIEIYGDYSRWKDIYNLNKDVVKEPSKVFPGQKLKLP